MLGAAKLARLREHAPPRADLAVEMARERLRALRAQPPRPLLRHCPRHLRHARRRRAGPGREWEYVKIRETAVVDEVERAREHRLGLGREAGDDVGTEHDVAAQPPHLF